jgi:ectoine hydroxylase-related dioxygenase (phytanoyl-CoA dioxygenase family)
MYQKFKINDKNITNFFNENGYAIVKNYFSINECNFFLKKVSKYANKEFSPIMNPDRIDFLAPQTSDNFLNLPSLTSKTNFFKLLFRDCQYFRSVITSNKILKLLKNIKKKKVNALMSQMIFKKAKSVFSKQSWEPHQDNSYSKNKNGHYITINIFMNNSNKKNGTLYIWEKSHKYGLFNYKKKISYREKDGKPGNVANSNINFKKKDLNFKKGDMLILHGNLVHGSYPNKSKRSRPLYSASYISDGEKFVAGKNAQRQILNKKVLNL